MTDFSGRTVLITGAGQGIGRSYTEAFARDGANVIAADINPPAETLELLKQYKSPSIGVTLDVTDQNSINAAIQNVNKSFGTIDVLVNNAAFYGGLVLAPFDKVSEADWDRSMNVNVKGTWLMCRAVAPIMRSNNFGRIINITSNVIFMGKPNFLHYVTSKGAVWALTNALSRELADTGITVNCVAPGYTITPATRNMGDAAEIAKLESEILGAQSVKRLLKPTDMVGAVQFLASGDASMVTGQTIVVDGGVIVG